MPTFSTKWDIKSLIEHKACINVVSRAIVRGVEEYHSNCPWCGGTDRFITRPQTGQYSCAIRSSGCGRSGDALDFLQKYCKMTFAEAAAELELSQFASASVPARVPPGAPSRKWQEQAAFVIERAQQYLWSWRGKEALEYLHSRGLTDETIKKFKLGYMPLDVNGRWVKFPWQDWGIDPASLTESILARGGVQIPDGIIIPWYVDGVAWKITVKRPGQTPSYGQLLGSMECLFNADSIQYDAPAMLVEGEFCAMSVAQQAGDLISCCATSGDKKARSSIARMPLTLASYVLQAFDEDASGDAASDFWTATIDKCLRWSPILAKDPNDFLQSFGGAALRDWVEAGILSANIEFGTVEVASAPADDVAGEQQTRDDDEFVEAAWKRYDARQTPAVETPQDTVASDLQAQFMAYGAKLGYPRLQISACSYVVPGIQSWQGFAATHDAATLARIVS